MNYEVVESKHFQDEWRVEAIDGEGPVFVAIFSGPAAKERPKRVRSLEKRCAKSRKWLTLLGGNFHIDLIDARLRTRLVRGAVPLPLFRTNVGKLV